MSGQQQQRVFIPSSTMVDSSSNAMSQIPRGDANIGPSVVRLVDRIECYTYVGEGELLTCLISQDINGFNAKLQQSGLQYDNAESRCSDKSVFPLIYRIIDQL